MQSSNKKRPIGANVTNQVSKHNHPNKKENTRTNTQASLSVEKGIFLHGFDAEIAVQCADGNDGKAAKCDVKKSVDIIFVQGSTTVRIRESVVKHRHRKHHVFVEGI